MTVEQFQATAHLQGGTLVKVRSRGFEFNLDEPKELGGSDTAMNPVEALWGLLMCAAVILRFAILII